MSQGIWSCLIGIGSDPTSVEGIFPAMEPFFIASAGVALLTAIILATIFYVYHSSDGFDRAWDDDAKKLLGQEEKAKSIAKKPTKAKGEKIQRQKLREIDLERYQSRVTSITDLEPEYHAFLAGYLQKLNLQISQLTDSVSSALDAKTAVESKIEVHKNSRVTAETKVAELKTSVSELKALVQKQNASRGQLEVDLTAAQKENATLHYVVNKSKEEIEKTKAQLALANEKVASASVEAKNFATAIEKSAKEKVELLEHVQSIEVRAQEQQLEAVSLKDKYEALTKQIEQLQAEFTSREYAISEQLKQSKLEAQSEKDTVIRAHAEDKRRWNEEELRMNAELGKSRVLLGKIEAEMIKIEEAKTTSQLEKVELEAAMQKKCELLESKNEEILAQCEKLETDKQQLMNEAEQFAQKKEQMETLEKKNGILEKLVQELRSKNCCEGEMQQLKLENVQLKEKNQELGAHNEMLNSKIQKLEAAATEASTDVGELAEQSAAGDSCKESKQKLEEELLRLKGLEEKCKAEKESIDIIKDVVEEAISTLCNQ